MTSFEELMLGPPGPAAKKVEEIVRAQVLSLAPGVSISTVTLAERVYPIAEGELNASVRKRIFGVLQALAKHELSDCATKGEPVKRRFGVVRPWLWHRSNGTAPAPRCCSKCGQPLPKQKGT